MLDRQRDVLARRPRVLIVEDEALIAQDLEELVRSFGLVVAEIALNLPSVARLSAPAVSMPRWLTSDFIRTRY